VRNQKHVVGARRPTAVAVHKLCEPNPNPGYDVLEAYMFRSCPGVHQGCHLPPWHPPLSEYPAHQRTGLALHYHPPRPSFRPCQSPKRPVSVPPIPLWHSAYPSALKWVLQSPFTRLSYWRRYAVVCSLWSSSLSSSYFLIRRPGPRASLSCGHWS